MLMSIFVANIITKDLRKIKKAAHLGVALVNLVLAQVI